MKLNNDYFEMLTTLSTYVIKGSEVLEEIFRDYNSGTIKEIMTEMHMVEDTADAAHHKIRNALAREFITPIDREDISMIAYEIDEVIDGIEDIVIRMYMFNIDTLRSEAFEFITVINQCAHEMHRMMTEFKNFRKSERIGESIIEINRLEELGDAIYVRAIRRLYTDETESVQILAWTELFNQMEQCCDDFEDVAELIHSVLMKNS